MNFSRIDHTTWRIEPSGAMRVPAIIYADEDLIRGMDDKVYEQAVNVAMLPGRSRRVRTRSAVEGRRQPDCHHPDRE
jgi:hypothetical protein